MLVNIEILDNLGNPLLPDTIIVNGVSITPSTSISYTNTDNSIFTISIEKENYYSYYQSFKVYDIDLNISITLINLNCKFFDGVEYHNNCCNASFFIIDNPCSNDKVIVKSSSSPADLYVYGQDNTLIDFGSQIVIPNYLLCKDTNTFLIVSKQDKDCGCDGTDYPPCYEEITVEILRQQCLCDGSFTFTNDFCYQKIYPFIDFETTKFFKQERWYLVKDLLTNFYFNFPCIRTNLLVYEQASNQYIEIPYRKEVNIIIYIKKEGEILSSVELSLPDDFTDEDLNTFLSSLVLNYTFEEKGKYELYAIVTTNCYTKEYIKELYVTDDINLYVNEDCRLYDLIICNDVFDISVKNIDSNQILANISFNNGVFTGNEGKIFITDDMKLHIGLDDGVYVVTINNGLSEKSFILVHFCNAKNCYISLSKKLYCSEENVTDRFMYSVVSFYMLYKLVIEYYTLHHPIEILQTTLSNSDNIKYIEINKALQKMKQICDACGIGLNEKQIYEDCGCNG